MSLQPVQGCSCSCFPSCPKVSLKKTFKNSAITNLFRKKKPAADYKIDVAEKKTIPGHARTKTWQMHKGKMRYEEQHDEKDYEKEIKGILVEQATKRKESKENLGMIQ